MLASSMLKDSICASEARAQISRDSAGSSAELDGDGGIAACVDQDQLAAWLRRLAQSMGFYAARYVHLGHAPCRANDIRPVPPARALSTVARERSYQTEDWLLFDPVRDRVRASFLPFQWTTRTAAARDLRQQRWLEAERARGVGAGIAIPIQDHAAGPAYVSLVGTDEASATRLIEAHVAELAFEAAQFHSRAKAILPFAGEALAPGNLTPRESECLSLAAVGKTVFETASTLGISQRTVEYHITNAATKLHAFNKVHAVAVALGRRLIRI